MEGEFLRSEWNNSPPQSRRRSFHTSFPTTIIKGGFEKANGSMAEKTLMNRARLGPGSARRLKDRVGCCHYGLFLFFPQRNLKNLIIDLVYKATFATAVVCEQTF